MSLYTNRTYATHLTTNKMFQQRRKKFILTTKIYTISNTQSRTHPYASVHCIVFTHTLTDTVCPYTTTQTK